MSNLKTLDIKNSIKKIKKHVGHIGRIVTSSMLVACSLTVVMTSVVSANSIPFDQSPLALGVPQSALVSTDAGSKQFVMGAPDAAANVGGDQTQSTQFNGMRVGIQAGHWQTANAPDELASLRTSTGAVSGSVREVDLNLKVAQQVAAILESQGVQVDLLPTTLPIKYKANAFVSIHADANGSTEVHGYKVASALDSAIPNQDQALVKDLYSDYGATTAMPTDNVFTDNMYYYYAFNNSNLQHTVAPTTPAAIVEMGYLSNGTDRAMMVNKSDVIAQGIAQGILHYLSDQQTTASR